MKRLEWNARRLRDGYLRRLRRSLAACPSVDRQEVERDVREHIEMELADAPEPVSRRALERVLEQLGNPAQWVTAECPGLQPGGTLVLQGPPEPWTLALLSLGFTVVALALPPFLWVGLAAAFLAARAAVAASDAHGDDDPAHRWLVAPALLAAYVPLMALVLLWPAVATRLTADAILELAATGTALPWQIVAVADRVADIRIATFDPAETARAVLRSGHYLIAPVGAWLLVLGLAVRAWPRALAAALRPLCDGGGERLSRVLLQLGGLALLWTLLQAAVKQV